VLVAHSKGGLEALAALLDPEAAARCAAFVAFQSPFFGSPVADAVAGRRVLRGLALALKKRAEQEALVVVLDRDLRIEVVSGSLVERSGRTQDELLGRRLADIVAPERQEEVLGHYHRGLGGERHSFTTSADGEIWYTLDIVPLRDGDGAVSGVMSIAREHLAYGRGDQWDAERLRALIENIPGAIYRVLPNGEWTVEFVSDQIEAITGYPASDFLGNVVRSYTSLIHPEDAEAVADKLRAALAERVPFLLEYRVLARDGSTRWVRERGQGIHDEQGNLLWVDGAIFRIDERARLAA
jgi:PAS domain S-box-containing protein